MAERPQTVELRATSRFEQREFGGSRDVAPNDC